jgi:hypothetical protein
MQIKGRNLTRSISPFAFIELNLTMNEFHFIIFIPSHVPFNLAFLSHDLNVALALIRLLLHRAMIESENNIKRAKNCEMKCESPILVFSFFLSLSLAVIELSFVISA